MAINKDQQFKPTSHMTSYSQHSHCYLTVPEVCHLTQLPAELVWRMLECGELTAIAPAHCAHQHGEHIAFTYVLAPPDVVLRIRVCDGSDEPIGWSYALGTRRAILHPRQDHLRVLRDASLEAAMKDVNVPASCEAPGALVLHSPLDSEDASERADTSRQRNQFKRCAIQQELRSIWPTIERDLRDYKRNGLGARARLSLGWWDRDEALAWARERGKLVEREKTASITPFSGL